jgi:hypothetical protein
VASKNQLPRDLRRRSIFDFFNGIDQKQTSNGKCSTSAFSPLADEVDGSPRSRHLGAIRGAKYNPKTIDPRLANLLPRKPTRVVTGAMANKTARTTWAIMARGETYRTGYRPALVA